MGFVRWGLLEPHGRYGSREGPSGTVKTGKWGTGLVLQVGVCAGLVTQLIKVLYLQHHKWPWKRRKRWVPVQAEEPNPWRGEEEEEEGFHIILRMNSDYFLEQHQPADLCNGEVLCFICGKNWIFKYYLDELRRELLKTLHLRTEPGQLEAQCHFPE
jgi:hypothetical protein